MKSDTDTIININSLDTGDHVVGIYQNNEELYSLLVPFIKAGLENHQKCIYVLAKETQEYVKDIFNLQGFDLSEHVANQSLVFLKEEDVYYPDGQFNANNVINLITHIAKSSKEEGYFGIRMTGNANWIYQNDLDRSDFLKYESLVNKAIQENGIIALCQYEKSKFQEAFVLDLIRTHEIIFLDGKFIKSKYFSPSDSFIPVPENQSSNAKSKKIIHDLLLNI